MSVSLLPAPLSADPSMLALEALASRISALDPAPVLTHLVDLVDASALAHLAYEFSLLDEAAWSLAESEEQRRTLLKEAVAWHARKGTPWAIREVVRLLGFGEIEIQEGVYPKHLDGAWALDGSEDLGNDDVAWVLDGSVNLDGTLFLGELAGWARYEIQLQNAITADQAALLRLAVEAVAPARCRLVKFTYPRAIFRLNGEYVLDGSAVLDIYQE